MQRPGPLCNDVMMPGTVVDGEALAVTGTVTLSPTPDGPYQALDMPNQAVVELYDVVFENLDTGRQRTLTTSMAMLVGWLPG